MASVVTVGKERGEIHKRCREDPYRISLVSGWNWREKPRVLPGFWSWDWMREGTAQGEALGKEEW